MVKVSFHSALGHKEPSKEPQEEQEEQEEDEEALVPEQTLRRLRQRQSRAWCWCLCLGVALVLSGALVGGAYLYHRYFLDEEQVFFCGVNYREELMMELEEEVEKEVQEFLRLEETFQVLEPEQVELIHVPVPEFDSGDPADIVHDFQKGLTAYLDLSLNKCYVIPLNTSIVLPPRDLLELLLNLKAGTYLPQSYLVHEEMIVTERLHHVEQLGSFINKLCQGVETYKLQRRDSIQGMQKREALNCRRIRHFESHVVVETQICEL